MSDTLHDTKYCGIEQPDNKIDAHRHRRKKVSTCAKIAPLLSCAGFIALLDLAGMNALS